MSERLAMAPELGLSGACSVCGSEGELFGSGCRHLTLCLACGKRLAEAKLPCAECGVPVTRLIQEYVVRPHAVSRQFFVGRFLAGLPTFSRKKPTDPRWAMQREGLQGRQVSDTLREKYKGKPWVLEDDIGQQQYQGQLEGGQQATYYVLMPHGKEILATQVNSWYNFQKMAHYKQLTLEEAEEQMRNRRKTADGYQRWLMKVANTGAAAFNDMETIGGASGGGPRRKGGDDDENDESDRGEEDEDEEEARKSKLAMNKGQPGDEDAEEPARGDDLDLDDEEPEKGDDWEHEETFTDDDEAPGNEAEEREDINPEIPAPPEIKQEEEDEAEGEEGDREGGGLSKSGRELKKLLGKAAGLDESESQEDEEDEEGDLDTEDIGLSPVLLPSKKDVAKEEVSEVKVPAPSLPVGRTPPSTSAKGKRKSIGDEGKPAAAAGKRVKAEHPSPAAKTVASSTVKKELMAKPAPTPQPRAAAAPPVARAPPVQQGGAVSEEEVRIALRQSGPIKSTDLVAKFRSRLKTAEDKASFAAILKRISRIQKTDGVNFIVLR